MTERNPLRSRHPSHRRHREERSRLGRDEGGRERENRDAADKEIIERIFRIERARVTTTTTTTDMDMHQEGGIAHWEGLWTTDQGGRVRFAFAHSTVNIAETLSRIGTGLLKSS